MKFNRVVCGALAVLTLSGMAVGTASAAALINFDQSNGIPPGGTITYDGNGGALQGSNIRFDSISLEGAAPPAGNQSSLFCQGCRLDFTTGPNTSENASANTWTFASGGSFTLTGSVFEEDGSGNAMGPAIATGTLANGIFASDFSSPTASRTGPNSLRFGASGTDSKSSDLLAYFGIDPNTPFDFENTEISAGNASFGSNGSINGTITGADINNTVHAQNNSVPEPEELGLFGIGLALLLFGVYSRRSSGGPA